MSGKSVNVKVAVRCRPLSRKERDNKCETCVKMVDGTQTIVDLGHKGEKTFSFDHSYFWDTPQDQVYTDLAQPIVKQALDGFNGTIFAYGQTGSGKTFSMMGGENGEHPGIIPLMNEELFKLIDKRAEDGTQFLILVSYLEIYNEVIKDLLNPSDKQMKIREDPRTKSIYVQDLAELVVKNADEVRTFIEQGNKVRKVAATNMNDRSSRSHTCFSIKIEQKKIEKIGDIEKTTSLTAKINLVDLAGSERASKTGAKGDRLKEGAAINLSLSALGNVINALSDSKKNSHIPYRNSKLTRLLQDSLGGNALTVMIAALSPADYNSEETYSTLQYAQRAKLIQNKTVKNEDVHQRMIRQLKEEIEHLRMQLATMGPGSAPTIEGGVPQQQSEEDKKMVDEMKRRIMELQNAQKDNWQEKERLSALYEEERQKNLASEAKIYSVMQTVKEEHLDAIKRMKMLHKAKVACQKNFQKSKSSYGDVKTTLQTHMNRYKELLTVEDPNEQVEVELQKLLETIETKKASLLKSREEMNDWRSKLKKTEEEMEELKAQTAAHKMMLGQDEELRQQIREDERKRLLLEQSELVEEAIKDERNKINEEAEQRVIEAEERFNEQLKEQLEEALQSQKEKHEKELNESKEQQQQALMNQETLANQQQHRDNQQEDHQPLLDKIEAISKENQDLQTQLKEEKRQHEEEIIKMQNDHRMKIREFKAEYNAHVKEIIEGFDEENNDIAKEKRMLQKKVKNLENVLASATKDLILQMAQYEDLKRQVSWEPQPSPSHHLD